MDDARDALAPATVLEGYRIERVLGAGGFGVTYLATEIETERRVAIKEYLPGALAQRESGSMRVRPVRAATREDYEWGLGRFRDEARTLVRIRHPAVVSTLRFFQANGTAYLVMDYLEGETLGALLRRRGELSEGDVMSLLRPLLDGLRVVHAAGYLHRDIKPDNIYMRSTGEPVLLDFGAARLALGQRSLVLTAIVTPRYAPFEQYTTDGRQGPWTDLYGLGAVLYRCVTGDAPRLAPDRIAARIREDDDLMPPAATLGAGRYSPALLHAIDAALEPIARDRPQDIDAFVAMLDKKEEPRRPEATPLAGAGQTPSSRATAQNPRSPRRGRRWAAIGLAGAVALLVVAVGSRYLRDGAETAPQPSAPATHADGTFTSQESAVAYLCASSISGGAGWRSLDGNKSGTVVLLSAASTRTDGRHCCEVELRTDDGTQAQQFCRTPQGTWSRP
jgi:serine/threonine protein kinase